LFIEVGGNPWLFGGYTSGADRNDLYELNLKEAKWVSLES